MKKYYVSHVDFSEIDALSNDEVTRENALAMLTEAGAVNGKGKPDTSYLNTLSGSFAFQFFGKLAKRLSRRRGGIRLVYEMLQKLSAAKEYTAMYLYIVIHYGFLEWQVPRQITCLPAVPDALKIWLSEFMADFEEFLTEMDAQEAAEAESAASQNDTEPESQNIDDSE